MIATPKLSHIPIEGLLVGVISYVAGSLANVNAKLSALILVIASVSNTFLFQGIDKWGSPLIHSLLKRMKKDVKISSEVFYMGTNAFISTLTIFVLYRLQLISARTVGMGIFVTAAILLARVKILTDARKI